VSGSKGDILILTPKGFSAFFDGEVMPGSPLNRAGATTTRHVFEAKAWDYGGYTPSQQKSKLKQLLAEAEQDKYVAKECKYTYSVVTTSPTLTKDFRKSNPSIPIYNIAFPRNQKQIENGTGIVYR
jgi:hypothetical protein